MMILPIIFPFLIVDMVIGMSTGCALCSAVLKHAYNSRLLPSRILKNKNNDASILKDINSPKTLPQDLKSIIFDKLDNKDLMTLMATDKTMLTAVRLYYNGLLEISGVIKQKCANDVLLLQLFNGEEDDLLSFDNDHDYSRKQWVSLSQLSNECLDTISQFCQLSKRPYQLHLAMDNVENEMERLVLISQCKFDLKVYSHAIVNQNQLVNSLKITHLSLKSSHIMPEEIDLIHDMIAKTKHLESLEYQTISMNIQMATSLSLAMKAKGNKLKYLKISAQMNNDHASIILQSLTNENCKVQTLDLLTSQLKQWINDVLIDLSFVIRSPRNHLKHLSIGYNPKISFEGCQAFASALSSDHCKLTHLIIPFGHLGNECAALLSESSTLRHLDVSGNAISASGVKAIARAISHPNSRITSINLSHNKNLGLLGNSLHKLQSLNLESTGLTASDIVSVMSSISDRLEELSLAHNKLEIEGIMALTKFIPSTRIKYLNLDKTGFGMEGFKAIAQLLRMRKSKLKHIRIDNEISENNSQTIAIILSKAMKSSNCQLLSIHLPHSMEKYMKSCGTCKCTFGV